MTNIQLYLAIGIPTFSVMLAILAGVFQHVQLNARLTSLESHMSSRFAVVEQDLKQMFRLMSDLDVRIARLEERSTR